MNAFKFVLLVALATGIAPAQSPSHSSDQNLQNIGGVALVARDSSTGDIGIILVSDVPAAGAFTAYAGASSGAVLLMGNADPRLGPAALHLLEQGSHPREALDTLMRNDSESETRQIAILDTRGNAFSFTGSRCLPYAGYAAGSGFCVQGNSLAGDQVLNAISAAFQTADGELSDRLLKALESVHLAGEQKFVPRSAAMLVVRDHGGYGGLNDRYIDLRVDADSLPLARLHQIYMTYLTSYLFDARWRSIDALNQDQKFDNARALLKRVVASMNEELRLKPDDPQTLGRIAFALATHNVDRPRALELAQRASKLAPASATILNVLAECYYQLNRYDEAISVESQLVAKDPANPLYFNQLKKFRDAKENAGH